ncbi:glycosyltransferase [Candidatus Arthromitus sp. SFB-rat-Yit]|uniref:glycosyltransferase n=1 Tax=Candidatus Arthromitus sp. SFB-rat-Yit TaxID=1041504 RepID=UPI000227A6A9|nr:glycosyltransferase [Candidatus Arthromitus sp. SFB-rat-Yit]BAK80614.1 glycosyltransferase [Candidatus Arthromitus sp. SFB-rat-Yit]
MSNLKKILICIYNLQGGGAERVLINLLNSFVDENYDVTLLVLRKEGIYLNKIPSKIKVIYAFKTLFGKKLANKVLGFLSSKILYKMFVREKFDIEISFLEGFATKVISGSLSNSKKIAWIHADFSNYHWTNKIFSYENEKKFYSKFDNIVCVSKLCAKSFTDKFGFRDKIKIVYNLLDKNLENYTKFKFNNVFNKYKTTKIIYVGRIEKEKSVGRLIESFEEILCMGYSDITLFILGDGSLKKYLEEYVFKNNLSNNIKFIPFKEDVYDYILSSDYVIVPSYSESFSLVLAESLYLGKICIATDTAGAREVLKNGEYGIIVDNSKEGIKCGILKVINNPELKNRYISKMNKDNYEFNRKNVLNKIFDIINF